MLTFIFDETLELRRSETNSETLTTAHDEPALQLASASRIDAMPVYAADRQSVILIIRSTVAGSGRRPPADDQMLRYFGNVKQNGTWRVSKMAGLPCFRSCEMLSIEREKGTAGRIDRWASTT